MRLLHNPAMQRTGAAGIVSVGRMVPARLRPLIATTASGRANGMSRSISIYFRDEASGTDTSVEVRSPYDLLGGQRSSMAFWSIPRIKEVGIERLAELGVTDPVIFHGWDDMAVLKREVAVLDQHLSSIDYDVETKCAWLSHLSYCYHLLVQTAPAASTPICMIG